MLWEMTWFLDDTIPVLDIWYGGIAGWRYLIFFDGVIPSGNHELMSICIIEIVWFWHRSSVFCASAFFFFGQLGEFLLTVPISNQSHTHTHDQQLRNEGTTPCSIHEWPFQLGIFMRKWDEANKSCGETHFFGAHFVQHLSASHRSGRWLSSPAKPFTWISVRWRALSAGPGLHWSVALATPAGTFWRRLGNLDVWPLRMLPVLPTPRWRRGCRDFNENLSWHQSWWLDGSWMLSLHQQIRSSSCSDYYQFASPQGIAEKQSWPRLEASQCLNHRSSLPPTIEGFDGPVAKTGFDGWLFQRSSLTELCIPHAVVLE